MVDNEKNDAGMINDSERQAQDEKENERKIRADLYKTTQENLISSLLVKPERALDVMSMLDDDDFNDAGCKHIFHAMRTMVMNSIDIAPDAVQIELEKEGNLVAAGGAARILSLFEHGFTAGAIATVDTYARFIKDASIKSKAIKDLNDVRNDLTIDSGKTAREVIERTQSKLTDLTGSLETSKMASSISDYYDTFIDDLKERMKTFKESGDQLAAAHGIPTGFKTLDAKLHGWQPGNTIVVGARTGIGKSVFAVDEALAAASAGMSVLFFSMEMTLQEIETRFVACITGISINKLVSGNIDDKQLEMVVNAKKEVSRLKIDIDTSQDSTIEYIRSTASKKAQSEDGLDLVIIDYLGLIKYIGNRNDKQNQIADMSRSLKEMAMTMGIPVIILVQLDNRLRGEEAEEEPTLAHIRESGAIANDANVIILLHRRKDETKKASDIPTKFIIEKNRGGEKGSFMCHSWLWRAKFEEIKENNDDDESNESDEDGIDDIPSSNDDMTDYVNNIVDDDIDGIDDGSQLDDIDDDDDSFDELFG